MNSTLDRIIKKLIYSRLFRVLLIIFLIGSITGIYCYHNRIKEPIFFKNLRYHYLPSIADSLVETTNLQLKYITNSWDKRKISEAEFVNHPEFKISTWDSDEKACGIYRPGYLTLYLDWAEEVIEKGAIEEIEVNQIHVTYDDGTVAIYDIGTIVIYGGMEDSEPFEPTGWDTYIDTTREQKYDMNQDIEIVGFSKRTERLINEVGFVDYVSLNGIAYNKISIDNPLFVTKGEELQFMMVLQEDWKSRLNQPEYEYDSIKIKPKLLYKDQSGDIKFISIMNHEKVKELESYKQIKEYVKTRN